MNKQKHLKPILRISLKNTLMIKYMTTTKQLFFIYKILITIIICITIMHSQLQSSQPIIPYSGYDHSKNIAQKILTSFDKNSNAFVCYSGYKIIKNWNETAGYRTTPNIEKETNILVEIKKNDPQEYLFDQVVEIDNDQPVNDIKRFNKKYLIAHKNKLLTYKKQNTEPLKLVNPKHYEHTLTDHDALKKIFTTRDNNILTVSSCGAVFKNKCTNDSVITPLFQSFAQPKEIHSIAYNPERNIVLFGLAGAVNIADLKKKIQYILQFNVPQCTFYTLDTCTSHVLLSNVIPNPDATYIAEVDQHFEIENCCRKNVKVQNCEDCIKKMEEWHISKNIWDQETITITAPRHLIAQHAQKASWFNQPSPQKCTHMIPAHLKDSCNNATIILLSWDDIIDQITTEKADVINMSIAQHQIHNFTMALGERGQLGLVTQLILTDNFLFFSINNRGTRLAQDGNTLYKYPLKNIDITKIPWGALDEKIYYSIPEYKMCSSGDKDPFGMVHDTPLRIDKQENTLSIARTVQYCGKDCQRHCTCSKSYPCKGLLQIIFFNQETGNIISSEKKIENLPSSLSSIKPEENYYQNAQKLLKELRLRSILYVLKIIEEGLTIVCDQETSIKIIGTIGLGFFCYTIMALQH